MTNARFSASYVDCLLDRPDWTHLADLAGIVTTSEIFDASKPNHGLPVALFALIEVLSWEAASARSGVWTYYEATSIRVQESVSDALKQIAPLDLAHAYWQGISTWHTPSRASATDIWLRDNELRVKEWVTQLGRTNRSDIHALA